jgi:hypothetical protein
MKTLLIALIALFVCNTPVLAQTGIPTPGPGIIGKNGEFIQGEYVHAGPGIDIGVPGRACRDAVYKALDAHAPVPVSDPRCAEAMQKALTIQSQNPEPTDSFTPEAVDTPPIE